jgi:hypothetical protein
MCYVLWLTNLTSQARQVKRARYFQQIPMVLNGPDYLVAVLVHGRDAIIGSLEIGVVNAALCRVLKDSLNKFIYLE